MPTPAPTPEPTPEVPSWVYDDTGILRNGDPAVSYAACALTWIARSEGTRLPEEELAKLRAGSREDIADLQLDVNGSGLLHEELELLLDCLSEASGFHREFVVARRQCG